MGLLDRIKAFFAKFFNGNGQVDYKANYKKTNYENLEKFANIDNMSLEEKYNFVTNHVYDIIDEVEQYLYDRNLSEDNKSNILSEWYDIIDSTFVFTKLRETISELKEYQPYRERMKNDQQFREKMCNFENSLDGFLYEARCFVNTEVKLSGSVNWERKEVGRKLHDWDKNIQKGITELRKSAAEDLSNSDKKSNRVAEEPSGR